MDWNNDGRLDIVTGENNGNVRIYLRNAVGTLDDCTRAQVGASTFVAAGNFSKPEVADWNGDGKKDLIVGNGNGGIDLLLNTGTNDAPAFSAAGTVMAGGSALSVGSYGRASPVFVDWDGDGRKDLIVGATDGQIHFFKNSGTSTAPAFTTSTPLSAGGATIVVSYYSRPEVCDYNGDGVLDIITGYEDYDNAAHGVKFFKGTGTTGLPAGWSKADIGTVASTGNTTYSGGMFTLRGSGLNIGGTADSFHFAYKTLSGNGSIVARVRTIGTTPPNPKVGIMFRDGAAANAKHVAVLIRTTASGSGMLYRATTGGSSALATNTMAVPYWLKLVRSGSIFTGYKSSNGTTWTKIFAKSVTMATSVRVGLVVCAVSSTTANTASFSNVAITAGASIMAVPAPAAQAIPAYMSDVEALVASPSLKRDLER